MNNIGGLGAQLAVKRKPKGPCPNCGLKVDSAAEECPHCNYKLSSADRASLEFYLQQQQAKGRKLALIVFPLFIGLILLMYELKNA
jgi:predicted amidophosphoribosyltransferase